MNIDDTIRGLFQKLETRKASVEALKKQISKSWKTNGTFRFIGSTSTTNIQTASADVLAQAATELCLLSAAKSEASAKLGIEIDAKAHGFSVDDWFDDFKKRLATINVRDEEKQVEALESRLNSVLSPEQRRAIEVELLLKEI